MKVEKVWVLWDGSCGLCSWSVQRLRRFDRKRRLVFSQFQNAPSPPMRPGLEERCLRELVVVAPDGRELGGARAVFFALRGTSLGWLAAWWSLPPFVWLASGAYALVARNRGFLSKTLFRAQVCGLDHRYPEVD